MYRGFNLNLKPDNVKNLYFRGLAFYNEYKEETEVALDDFISPDGDIDGAAMQDYWFPQVKKQIFISHSREDLDMAIAFGGWLKARFGLSSFIDSCIWGHCNKLIKKIDSRYTWKKERGAYDYDQRNYSTSHVHMMLSVALTQMIDQCECLFFLNTPSSISTSDVINHATNSPWIFSELSISKYINKRVPNRLKAPFEKAITRLYSLNESEDFRMKHRVDLGILTNITWDDMLKWKNGVNELSNSYYDPLKTLYNLHPKNSIILS